MQSDADYIIFEGIVNDIWQNVPLGVITSGYTATLDEYTFCGAMESICKTSIDKWQGKKIGFIGIYRIPGAEPSLSTWLEQAELICKKWSMPYLDLHAKSGLCLDNANIKSTYTKNNDGTHINTLAIETIIAPKIDAWMKTL
jgi:hypothetical protein